MGVITVSGIKLYAYHGCMQEEAKIGSAYEVDVLLEADFSGAAMTDDLTQTVDYVAVNKIVTQEMAIRSTLLEHVAKNFMQGIYLGYMYSRWRKIRGFDKYDPVENTGQMKSSFKEFEKKIK